jgi:hypothetical protein
MPLEMNMRHLTLVASATLAVLLGAGATPASAACDPGIRAIQYMHSVQMADGSIDGSIGETADYVIGAAASGIDPSTLKATSGKSPLDYFTADLNGAQSSLADANELGKLIQGIVAAHQNPNAFDGIDLVNALLTGSTPGGSPKPYYNPGTGVFYDSASGNNQTFAQANAILGLVVGNSGTPVPAKAVTALKGMQSASGATKGGWSDYGTFTTQDTSMAIMALAAAGDTASNDPAVYSSAFTYLHSQQDPASGGFTDSTDFGSSTSDPVSDSLVLQALLASGQDPSGSTWTNSKGNAPTDIVRFQDATTGGFVYATGQAVQAFATSQTVVGLRHTFMPVTGSYTAGATMPAAGCPSAVVVQASPTPQAATAAASAPKLPAAGHTAAVVESPSALALGGALGLILLVIGLVWLTGAGGLERSHDH